jgi:hypothetical protein
MNLEQLLLTLQNEYISGKFFMDGNRIGWIYNSVGASTPEEAEDRWLSFLGAKLTTQNIIESTGYRIVEKFEINNRIGFFIEGQPEPDTIEQPKQKSSIFTNLFS